VTKKKDINKLNITISGTAGSGKNTLLFYIGSLLTAAGFEVNIASKEYDNILPKERLKNLASLHDKGTVIKLETKQVNRSIINSSDSE